MTTATKPWHVGNRAFLLAVVTALLVLAVPAAVQADRCGGRATVDPESGPPGTAFVFRTNVGASSDLTLTKNGEVVGVVPLNGSGDVSFTYTSQPGDEGEWVATALVRSAPDCGAEARFTVTGLASPALGGTAASPILPAAPNPTTAQGPSLGVETVLAALFLLAALVTMLRVLRASGSPGSSRVAGARPRRRSRD